MAALAMMPDRDIESGSIDQTGHIGADEPLAASTAMHSQRSQTTISKSLRSFLWRWRWAFYYPFISLCISLPILYPISLAYIRPTALALEKDRASRLCSALATDSPKCATDLSFLASFLTTLGYQYCIKPQSSNSSMIPPPSLCPWTLPSDSVSCTVTSPLRPSVTISLYPDTNKLSMVGWLPITINLILIIFPLFVALLIAALAAVTGYMRARVRMSFDELQIEADQLRSLMVRQYELIDILGKPQERPSDEFKRSPSRSEGLQAILDKVQVARNHLMDSDVESMAKKEEIVLLGPLPWSSGDVYKGAWRGSTVAVKSTVLTNLLSRKAKVECIALLEAAISSSASHPHIAQLYTYSIKVSTDKNKIALADKAARELKIGLLSSSPGFHSGDHSQSLTLEGLRPGSSATLTGSSSPLGVAPLAVAPEAVEVLLCFEYCDCGSLRDMLKSGTFLDGEGLNYPAIIATALDIARGLAHIHEHGTVLGDLTASSVWLKRDYGDGRGVVAKVADFGQSFQLSSSPFVLFSESFQGNLSHMAPETILEGKLSKATDVYSFGILLYELFTSSNAFSAVPYSVLGHQITRDKKRPNFPLVVPQGYRSLAEACWNHDPDQRPRFESIVERLVDLKSSTPAPTRPLKKLTLLVDMIHKSQIEASESKSSLESDLHREEEAEELSSGSNVIGRQKQVRRNKTALGRVRANSALSATKAAEDQVATSSNSKGRFISGGATKASTSPSPSPKHSPPLPNPYPSPKHSPPLPAVPEVSSLMVRTSPNSLLPLPPHMATMGRSTSEPSSSSLAQGHDYNIGTWSGPKESTQFSRKSDPLGVDAQPLNQGQGEGFEGGDVLASLLISLQSGIPSPLQTTEDLASNASTSFEPSLKGQGQGQGEGQGDYQSALPFQSHSNQGGSWEDEGEGIVLVPGTVLSVDGAYLPDTPLSAPISTSRCPPLPRNDPGALSSPPGSRRGKKLGPVEKAIARMKNISVRKSTTCSMETIDESSVEGEGPSSLPESHHSEGPLSHMSVMATARQCRLMSPSGPQAQSTGASSSTAAAVASVVGTLSAHGLKGWEPEVHMSDNQMKTLLEQQAHRAVMEAKSVVDQDNPVLVIGRDTSPAPSGSLIATSFVTMSERSGGAGGEAEGEGGPSSQLHLDGAGSV